MTEATDRLSTPPGAQGFSRPLVVDDVPDEGLDRTIEADPTECEGVAEEIGLPALRRLVAHLELAWQSGRRLRVQGVVEASITQICVVSLEPFESDVTHPIDVTFAAPAPPTPPLRSSSGTSSRRRSQVMEARSAPAPVKVTEGEADPPDPIIDGRIDLGAVAVEFLALALDIHPRKPGVHFSDLVVGEGEDEKPSPFAALARLKDRT